MKSLLVLAMLSSAAPAFAGDMGFKNATYTCDEGGKIFFQIATIPQQTLLFEGNKAVVAERYGTYPSEVRALVQLPLLAKDAKGNASFGKGMDHLYLNYEAGKATAVFNGVTLTLDCHLDVGSH